MGLAIRIGLVYMMVTAHSAPTQRRPKMAFNLKVGKDIEFAITAEMLEELAKHGEAFGHVIMTGLKNLVQDSHASVKREDFATEDEWKAESRKVAEQKLGSIIAGDVRKQSTARTPKLSDREAFARKWLVAKLKAAWVAKNGKDGWKAKTEGDDGAAFIAALIEKNAPKFEAEIESAWQKEMAERAASKEIADSVDLDI